MSTTKTRRELVFRALADLGVIAAGQTPSDDDVSAVDALVDGMVDELATRNVAYLGDPGTLGPSGGEYEPALFLALGSWLANAAAAEFGGQYSEDIRNAVEQRIRHLAAASATYRVMTAEHF